MLSDCVDNQSLQDKKKTLYCKEKHIRLLRIHVKNQNSLHFIEENQGELYGVSVLHHALQSVCNRIAWHCKSTGIKAAVPLFLPDHLPAA